MKYSKTILRREFIIYLFSVFIFFFIAKDQLKKEEIDIDSEIIKKIKTYNDLREIKSKKDLRYAIKSDLKNNKTIFVVKKLYTYAEIEYRNLLLK